MDKTYGAAGTARLIRSKMTSSLSSSAQSERDRLFRCSSEVGTPGSGGLSRVDMVLPQSLANTEAGSCTARSGMEPSGEETCDGVWLEYGRT